MSMFEKFQQLKEASVRAAKRGADAIKTVSDEVKAATQNTVVSTSSAPPAVLSRTAGASMKTQLMDEFQSLCQYLDNLKVSDREEELSGAETEVIRGSLKRIIFALSMDNERYMAASYRSHEKANPKDLAELDLLKTFLQGHMMTILLTNYGLEDHPRGLMSLTLGFVTTILRRIQFPLLQFPAVSKAVAQLVSAAVHYFEFVATRSLHRRTHQRRSDQSEAEDSSVSTGPGSSSDNFLVISAELEDYRAQIDVKLTALLAMIWKNIATTPMLLDFFYFVGETEREKTEESNVAGEGTPSSLSVCTTKPASSTHSFELLTCLLPFVSASLSLCAVRPKKISAKYNSNTAAKEALVVAFSCHIPQVDEYILFHHPYRGQHSPHKHGTESSAVPEGEDDGGFLDNLLLDLHQSFQRAISEVLLLHSQQKPATSATMSPAPTSGAGMPSASPTAASRDADGGDGEDGRQSSISAFISAKVNQARTLTGGGTDSSSEGGAVTDVRNVTSAAFSDMTAPFAVAVSDDQIVELEAVRKLLEDLRFIVLLIEVSSTTLRTARVGAAAGAEKSVKDHFTAKFQQLFLTNCLETALTSIANETRLLYSYRVLRTVVQHLQDSVSSNDLIRRNNEFTRGEKVSSSALSVCALVASHFLSHQSLMNTLIHKASVAPPTGGGVAVGAVASVSMSRHVSFEALRLLNELLSCEPSQYTIFTPLRVLQLRSHLVPSTTGKNGGDSSSNSATPIGSTSTPGDSRTTVRSISYTLLLDKLCHKVSAPVAPIFGSARNSTIQQSRLTFENVISMRIMSQLYSDRGYSPSCSAIPHSNEQLLVTLWDLLEKKLVKQFLSYSYTEQTNIMNFLSNFLDSVVRLLVRLSSAEAIVEDSKITCFVLVTLLGKFLYCLDGLIKSIDKKVQAPAATALSPQECSPVLAKYSIANLDVKLAATRFLNSLQTKSDDFITAAAEEFELTLIGGRQRAEMDLSSLCRLAEKVLTLQLNTGNSGSINRLLVSIVILLDLQEQAKAYIVVAKQLCCVANSEIMENNTSSFVTPMKTKVAAAPNKSYTPTQALLLSMQHLRSPDCDLQFLTDNIRSQGNSASPEIADNSNLLSSYYQIEADVTKNVVRSDDECDLNELLQSLEKLREQSKETTGTTTNTSRTSELDAIESDFEKEFAILQHCLNDLV